MPQGGHNKKSPQEHKAAGTYRKDRHKEPPAAPAAPDLSPPPGLPAGLAPVWRTVLEDLAAVGTVTKIDLEMLSTVFRHKANAQRLQALLEAALDSEEPSTTDISKLQSALASATGTYLRQLGIVTTAVQRRPKPAVADDWLAATTST